MLDKSPLVSVLMTAFNREDYISEAIESVLSSTYKNWELIIVDDCSTDNTVNIARNFELLDSRVKLYINERNLGQFPNRNKASTYAGGKYLKYLDSDDKILDYGLAYCVEQMEKYPEAGLGMYDLYERKGSPSTCWSSEEIIHEHFFVRQQLSIGPSGTIIRRDQFEANGKFDIRFGVPSDMFFNIRFASLSPIVLLPLPFVYYRRHDGQEINNRLDYLKYGYLYFKELLTNVKLPLGEKEIKYLYQKMNKRHSVNLTKYFFKSKNLRVTHKVMKDTEFSVFDYFVSFFH